MLNEPASQRYFFQIKAPSKKSWIPKTLYANVDTCRQASIDWHHASTNTTLCFPTTYEGYFKCTLRNHFKDQRALGNLIPPTDKEKKKHLPSTEKIWLPIRFWRTECLTLVKSIAVLLHLSLAHSGHPQKKDHCKINPGTVRDKVHPPVRSRYYKNGQKAWPSPNQGPEEKQRLIGRT